MIRKLKDNVDKKKLLDIGFIENEYGVLFYYLIDEDFSKQLLFFRVWLGNQDDSNYRTIELIYDHSPSDAYVGEIYLPVDKITEILDLVEEVSNE
jgi:hypothetical protein